MIQIERVLYQFDYDYYIFSPIHVFSKLKKFGRIIKIHLYSNYSDQQIMSHLSLFEKSLSLYQSRLMMFSKKKIFKNTNIEQVIVIVTQLSSNIQSSYHCILLNLSLFIN
jgi:hypothetical protein